MVARELLISDAHSGSDRVPGWSRLLAAGSTVAGSGCISGSVAGSPGGDGGEGGDPGGAGAGGAGDRPGGDNGGVTAYCSSTS
ncbi:MAG: hypothetical protein ACYDGY_03930 [Acidimicrobiales bacterium]